MKPRRTKNVTVCGLCDSWHTTHKRKKEIYKTQERFCPRIKKYVVWEQKSCKHFEFSEMLWCPGKNDKGRNWISPSVCINRQTKNYPQQCVGEEKCKVGRMIITSYRKITQ